MNDRIRISDADREQVVARLRDHFAEGRLTQDELDERVAAALSAKTAGDLRRIMADLPGPAPVPPSSRPGPPWAGGQWAGGPWVVHRRRPRILPLALLALFAVLVLPGAGLLFIAVFKLLLLFWLVATVAGIIAAARFRHRMRSYWRAGPGPYWERFSEHMR